MSSRDRPTVGPDLFRALAVAVPASLVFWALVGWSAARWLF